MGLFSKYKEYSKKRAEKRIEKAAKVVANQKAIKEERWASLQFLAELNEFCIWKYLKSYICEIYCCHISRVLLNKQPGENMLVIVHTGNADR